MRTDPQPTPSSMELYYPSDYLPHVNARSRGSEDIQSHWTFGWVLRLIGIRTRQLPPGAQGNCLEVGCGTGEWLLSLKAEGWGVEGIELSQSAVKAAREKGLNVACATVEKTTPSLQALDIIAAWMVLEHLHDPVDCLNKMRGWAGPATWLIGSVPDANALQWRVFGPRAYDLQLPTHLFHYTPNTLEQVLLAGGWKLEEIKWQRNANTPLRSLEYLLTDKGYLNAIKAIRWIRVSRVALPLRFILHWLSGITRQSGRIEFRARPIHNHE